MGIHMCLDMNTCQGLLKEWLKLNKWLAVTLTSIIISGNSDSYTFGLQRTIVKYFCAWCHDICARILYINRGKSHTHTQYELQPSPNEESCSLLFEADTAHIRQPHHG